MSSVFIAIGRTEDAFARSFALHIVTFIDIAITKLVDAFAILDIILPVADIYIAIGILVGSLARTLVYSKIGRASCRERV